MVQSLNIQDIGIAELVWRLQHAAYYVEAQYIGQSVLPPLMDTIHSLQNCGESFYGVMTDDELVGAISCHGDDDTVTICRLMVHPDYFRRGIAKEMLIHAETLYAETRMFKVAAGSDNIPAIRLYESMGYRPGSEREIIHGIRLREYCKIIG